MILTVPLLLLGIAVAAFNLGWHDGMRHDERMALIRKWWAEALVYNEAWHDAAPFSRTLPILLLGLLPSMMGATLDLPLLGYLSLFAAAAATWWLAFDLGHNVQQRQPLWYAGEAADSDEILRAMPWWGRAVLKVGFLLVPLTITFLLA